jgi:adenosylmethionine-8-amino-7-oxononanoate aminotransferase
MHGHTYQGHPIACAAALEVQKIMREQAMIQNVSKLGAHLERRLRQRIQEHPNVGDIRGRGFFWGIELVQDRKTSNPFPPKDQVALELAEHALGEPHNIALYPGGGCVDGVSGDHVIIAPPYNVTEAEIDDMVERTGDAIEGFFAGKAAAEAA